jgi:hypothetical protein
MMRDGAQERAEDAKDAKDESETIKRRSDQVQVAR